MKRQISGLILFLILLATVPATQAQLTFITNNGTINITGFNGNGPVNIPGTTNGFLVTSIQDYAFEGLYGITSVTIPDSVTNVGQSSFYACNGLTNVTLGNGLTLIDYSAFAGCTALLTVSIPASVTRIAQYAFNQCTGLTNLTVDPANPNYSSLNGILFDKDQMLLMQYPGGLMGSYSVPGTVMSIDVGAFESCGLSSVTLPGSVTNLGSYAFAFSGNLTNLNVGAGLLAIGDYEFQSCSVLPRLIFPASLTNLGVEDFYYCSALTNITVNAANPAFSSLNGVVFDKNQTLLVQYPPGLPGNYTVPNTVAAIGDFSFYNCLSLPSIVLPNGLGNIGQYAFWSCSSLTNVTFGSGLTNISDGAFQYCSSLGTVDLPANVAAVGQYTFNSCSSLTNVILGSRITSLGFTAFASDPSLATVFFRGNSPSPTNDVTVFDADTIAMVFYPATATGWGEMFDGLLAVPYTITVPPPNIASITLSGTDLLITGANGASTASYVLLTTTNLAAPLNQWSPVSTNTPGTDGNFSFTATNTVIPHVPGQYFLLQAQ